MLANYIQQRNRVIKPRAYKPGRRVKKPEPMFNKNWKYIISINGYSKYYIKGDQLIVNGGLLMMKAPFLEISHFNFKGTPDDAKRNTLVLEHNIYVYPMIKKSKWGIDLAISMDGVHIICMLETPDPPSYKKTAKNTTKKIEKAIGGKIPLGFLEELHLSIKTWIAKIINVQTMMDNLETNIAHK